MHYILYRYLTGTFIHEWKLCTLGGTGLDIKTKSKRDPQDPGAEYHQCYFKGVGYGLNNEYFELDMNTSKYYYTASAACIINRCGNEKSSYIAQSCANPHYIYIEAKGYA